MFWIMSWRIIPLSGVCIYNSYISFLYWYIYIYVCSYPWWISPPSVAYPIFIVAKLTPTKHWRFKLWARGGGIWWTLSSVPDFVPYVSNMFKQCFDWKVTGWFDHSFRILLGLWRLGANIYYNLTWWSGCRCWKKPPKLAWFANDPCVFRPKNEVQEGKSCSESFFFIIRWRSEWNPLALYWHKQSIHTCWSDSKQELQGQLKIPEGNMIVASQLYDLGVCENGVQVRQLICLSLSCPLFHPFCRFLAYVSYIFAFLWLHLSAKIPWSLVDAEIGLTN